MQDYEQKKRGIGSGVIIAVVAIVLIVAAFAFGLIDMDQTKDANLPEVAVQGGQAPVFDVDAAKVDVGTKSTTVDVPKVDVWSEKVGVDLPTVEVEKAK